ncbi:MAG: VWA domain-containing protein [Planctomycetota bacterium]
MIASRDGEEDGYFMMSLTAGEELEDSAGGMDYVFVVDISGSMANKGKLDLSTKAAQAFISSLGKDDRCEIMAFNTVPNLHFEELRSVDDQTKKETSRFLESQKARGGTNLRPALVSASKYKDPDRQLNIVVLSDGMTEQREQRELLSTMKSAGEGIRVFCIGVGNDVNRPLLNQVATEAGGLAAFISQGDNFARQAEAFRRKLVHPVMTDLSLEIDGVSSYDTLPNELPNLYHGSPVRFIGRYRNPGTGKVTLRGNIQGRAFEKQFDMEFPQQDIDNPQIERMWAFHNVQQLMAQVRKSGETPDLKEAIVQLCEGYSIVSQYASFIVLENDGEYKRWKIERRNATRIERDRKARKRLEAKLQKMREASMASLGPRKSGEEKTAQQSGESQNSVARRTPRQEADRPSQVSTRNFDFDVSVDRPSRSNSSRSGGSRRSGGGGGAIDPVTGLICIGFGGAAALRRRRKRLSEE